MSENEPQKPKIIVDEDWKAQVEREKSEAARQQQPSSAGSSASAAQSRPQEAAQEMPLPPATFPVLVTTLATQAMAALGQIPDASGKPSAPQPELARHFIDVLGMLEEKTQGNLTPHESRVLTDVLHELRMAFVQIQKAR